MTRIDGTQLSLRLVVPEDARYIHGLRTDPSYNQHLSAVTGSVEDQRIWIENYKVREEVGVEYYFVIERLDRERCGVVRLYDIQNDSFTWGSWILDANKPSKAALESAILLYQFGFEILGLDKSVFDVRRDNKKTLAFHLRFGAVETGSDDINHYFEYTRNQFMLDKSSYMNFLNTEGKND